MTRKQRYNPTGVSDLKNAASPMGNRKFRDPDYRKSRIQSEQGRLFPTFSHTRTSEKITTFSDIHYLVARCCNVRSGDSDSITGFKNLLIAMYKEGHISGNMKDVVSDEETAFSVVGVDSFMVMFDIAWQLLLFEMLANPAESDTDTVTATRPVLNTYTSLSLHLQLMEEKGLYVPNCIIKMLKDLLWIVKFQNEYQRGQKILPPRYFMPFTSKMVLATLQSFTTEWAQKCAQAKLHMDKFGIKYTQFKKEMLDVREITPDDPLFIAFLAHAPYRIREDGADAEIYPYATLSGTTDWSAVTYYFKDKPDEAPLNALIPFMHDYHATNNPYGGILFSYTCGTTQNQISFMSSNYDNISTWNVSEGDDYMLLFCGTYKQTDTWNISMTGTYRSAEFDIDEWPQATYHGLLKASGLTMSAINDILKTYFIQGAYS